MCGIVGALDLRGRRSFDPDQLARMAAAIAHRGPDGEGFFLAPGIAMAARRLALVDLEGGAQPVRDDRGELVACCNGELYDHDALRRALIEKGHPVRGRSDVALWPHLWAEHGPAMFDRARGQFALALWDDRARTLVLARDRVGICPLHVAEVDGWLLWASEIKGLLACGGLSPAVDARAIDHVGAFFSAPARRSFFEGIRPLAPGERMIVREGIARSDRHTELDFASHGRERRERDPGVLIDALDHALSRAVSRRLAADAPVAAYLSGGVDSNTVLALARRARGEAPASFTIGFDGAGDDETALARESARALGSRLTVVRMNPRAVADALPALHIAAEAPVVDTSAACLMRLAEEVHAQGFKAVLTGEGADEALAGYVWFRVEKALGVFDRWGRGLPSRLARSVAFGLVGGVHRPPSGPLSTLRTAQRDMYEPFARVRADLYSAELRSRTAAHDPYGDLDLDPARMASWHPLNRSLYTEYRVMLPGLLLHAKGDRAAMSAGVEARYPFLDDEVIDLCASIAPEYKLRGLTEKWLLRQVAARYVPQPIATRRKRMFRARLSFILLGPQRPSWVDALLSAPSLARAGLFDPVAVQRERTLQARLPAISPRRIVMDGALTAVIACQLWHHLYVSGGLCELPVWTAPAASPRSLALARAAVACAAGSS
jgi:asparagine synthase (glutamine-hydrolysing)